MLILIFLVLSFSLMTFAQRFDISVSAPSPFPQYFYQWDAVIDEPGGFVYLGGHCANSIDDQVQYGNSPEAFISKHFLNGSRIWTKVIGGPGEQRSYALVRNPVTNELFLSGTTDTAIYGGNPVLGLVDVFMARYASNGTRLFLQVFGTSNYDELRQLTIDPLSQQLVLWGRYNDDVSAVQCFISNGSLSRATAFLGAGVGGWAYASIPAVSPDAYYVTGSTYNGFGGQQNNGALDVFLSKVNLNGTVSWSFIWGSSNDEQGYSLTSDPSTGRIFVTGFTNQGSFNGLTPLGSLDVILIGVQSNGTYLWTVNFGGSGVDSAAAVMFHKPTGVLYLFGMTCSVFPGVSTGDCGGLILALSTNGTMLAISYQLGRDYKKGIVDSYAANAYLADFGGSYVTMTFSGVPSIASAVPVPAVTTQSVFPSWPILSALETRSGTNTLIQIMTTDILGATLVIPTPVSTVNEEIASLYSQTATAYTEASTTFPESGSTVTSSYHIDLILLLSGLLSVVGAILICTCVCCYFRAKKEETKFEGISLTTTTSLETLSSSHKSLVSTGSYFSMSVGMTTLVRTGFELSLPGFLNFTRENDFRINGQLARGGGGVVYYGEAFVPGLKIYGTQIIVKAIGNDGTSVDDLSEKASRIFRQEVSIMHYFRNEKHIAKLLGWSSEPASLLMKFYPLGALSTWAHAKSQDKTKRRLLSFVTDIARGLMAMHEAGFVHCDLKPANVLLDLDAQNNMFCVITDFGITAVVDDASLLVKEFSISNVRGISVPYGSPEAFQRFRGSSKSVPVSGYVVMKLDLYSLAVVSYELFSRRRPW